LTFLVSRANTLIRLEVFALVSIFGNTHADGSDSQDVAALHDLGHDTKPSDQIEKAAIQRPQPLSAH